VGAGGLFGALLLGAIMASASRASTLLADVRIPLAILALVSPPFIGAYSWIVLFGAGGWFRMLREVGSPCPRSMGSPVSSSSSR